MSGALGTGRYRTTGRNHRGNRGMGSSEAAVSLMVSDDSFRSTDCIEIIFHWHTHDHLPRIPGGYLPFQNLRRPFWGRLNRQLILRCALRARRTLSALSDSRASRLRLEHLLHTIVRLPGRWRLHWQFLAIEQQPDFRSVEHFAL